MKNPDSPARITTLAPVLALALWIGACADIVSRRETIGFAAGDAVHANKVLQTIDPWDERAGWTVIDQDGDRAVTAIDNYRAAGTEGAGELGQSSTTD